MRAVDIGLDGLDWTLDDKFDSYGGSQMDDDIGVVNEFGEQLAILDVIEVILHAPGGLEMADVFNAAGRKIIEQDDTIAAVKEPLCEV